MTDDVQLTIIVPVFNRDESLRRAIATIVPQSDRVSVVIVDDGSAPEFAAVIDELAAIRGSVVQVIHQPNRGPAAARNAGLSVTSSPFVMFLDSDDELVETSFAAINGDLLQRDDVGMVCGAIRIVSLSGELRATKQPTAAPGVPWAKLNWLPGSFIVRTDVAHAVGGYDEALHFAENTDFVLRLAEECRRRSLVVAATSDPFSVHYVAPDERRYDAKRLEAAIHLLRRGRFDLEIPSERAKLHAIAAVNAGRVGRYGLAVRHAALAALAEPRNPRHLARLAFSLSGPIARRHWLRT